MIARHRSEVTICYLLVTISPPCYILCLFEAKIIKLPSLLPFESRSDFYIFSWIERLTPNEILKKNRCACKFTAVAPRVASTLDRLGRSYETKWNFRRTRKCRVNLTSLQACRLTIPRVQNLVQRLEGYIVSLELRLTSQNSKTTISRRPQKRFYSNRYFVIFSTNNSSNISTWYV